jgi:hypothetical protein
MPEKETEKPTFEESLKEIDEQIARARNKWNLTVLSWLSYEDVAQQIRIHIWKKWDLYDPEKPLGPWVNRVIQNQRRNIIRNLYTNFARPCLRCGAAEGQTGCRIYHEQCVACPMYKEWYHTKKHAYDCKLPVPIDNQYEEASQNVQTRSIDIDESAGRLHRKMQEVLRPVEWRLYKCLYIEHQDDDAAAKMLGYTTNETGRSPGYKQIKNLKKAIIAKAKKVLENGEIDVI